jgi:hypothetical protein
LGQPPYFAALTVNLTMPPIEPKWVHGKWAVVEPARVLSITALMQRVCAYYQCEPTDPIAQPDC